MEITKFSIFSNSHAKVQLHQNLLRYLLKCHSPLSIPGASVANANSQIFYRYFFMQGFPAPALVLETIWAFQ